MFSCNFAVLVFLDIRHWMPIFCKEIAVAHYSLGTFCPFAKHHDTLLMKYSTMKVRKQLNLLARL